jgi:hypothetical protein
MLPLGKQGRKRYHHFHKFHPSKFLRLSSEFSLLLSCLAQMDKVELSIPASRVRFNGFML